MNKKNKFKINYKNNKIYSTKNSLNRNEISIDFNIYNRTQIIKEKDNKVDLNKKNENNSLINKKGKNEINMSTSEQIKEENNSKTIKDYKQEKENYIFFDKINQYIETIHINNLKKQTKI